MSSITNLVNHILQKLLNDLKPTISTPRHFRRWGGQVAHTRKKEKTYDLKNLGNLNKSQTWTDTLRSAQSPFKKLVFGNSS